MLKRYCIETIRTQGSILTQKIKIEVTELIQQTLCSSANFRARGLAKMRSSEGEEVGLGVLGSGELAGCSTGSCFGGGGAAESFAAGAPESDAGGL